jgi:CPA1 family monovalent cation:H+ antiporter
LFRHLIPLTTGTLGGNLLEFVTAFGVWIIAERLALSPILCVVAFAMTIARYVGSVHPRTRIHSFAVWESAVFLLNVLAFLLMGLQARMIVAEMEPDRLRSAAWFAFAVIVCLIVVRMACVLFYNRLAYYFKAFRGDYRPATLAQGVLVGWSGMRGLVTLATAFALPADFPQRDLIVLTAFAVVLATLVVQGLTLVPLVRLLKLDGKDEARVAMADASLAALEGKDGIIADHWRYAFQTSRAASLPAGDRKPHEEKRKLGLSGMRRQRETLDKLRAEQRVGADAFLILQEELDFQEVALTSESERHIEES